MPTIQSKLYDLAAIAQMLAVELGNRRVAPEDADKASVVAVADHLAEQLAQLRDGPE